MNFTLLTTERMAAARGHSETALPSCLALNSTSMKSLKQSDWKLDNQQGKRNLRKAYLIGINMNY